MRKTRVQKSPDGHNINQLLAPQKFKLQMWLMQHSQKLDGLTVEEAEKLCSKELEFKVTRHNLLGAKEVTGVKYELKRMRLPRLPDSRITALCYEIVRLNVEMGIKTENIDPEVVNGYHEYRKEKGIK